MTNRTLFLLALVAALALGVTGQSYAKVYASYVRVTQEGSALPFDGSFADRSGATIRYLLNHAADSVVINVVPSGGGASLKRLWAGVSLAGDNSINWDGSQDNGTPTPVGAYKLEITAYHGGFATYTQYHLSTPAISTRGVSSVNNPALRYFGFIYTASTAGLNYPSGAVRHAPYGPQYGIAPDSGALPTTGLVLGTTERRYATTVDQDGYAYVIGLTERRIFRYHLDTLNVTLFDSSAYGMRIQGLDVTGSGANKMLYVTGDSTVFRIPIGTQDFNTIVPTALARVTPGKRMVFWDAKVGEDSSLYVIYRADSAIAPLPALSRGILKFNLTTGSLPKTFADTVWSSFYADGDPVTLTMNHGATTGPGDDILYCNTDVRAPNTVLSAIYEFTGLNTTAPTRSVAWLDPDNNCSSTRSTVVTDVLGNLIYFENSNEQVVLVSPPSGPNSYTYTAFDQVTITAAGVAPQLLSIAVAREDLNGDRQPDRVGDTVKVIGVINSTNVQTTNFGYFMQDATGGIHLFQFGLIGAPALRPGDRVEVIGVIAYFRGTTEISPVNLATDITILDTGNVLTPIPLTIGQYKANPETYESRLIQFNVAHPLDFTSAQWPAAGSSANLNIWNGIDTTVLRIDSDTEVDGSPYPNFPVRLDAIATQFTSSATTHNNGYQVTPFFVANFVPINAPPLANFRLLTPVNGSQLEIDSTASYNFTWRRAVDFNNDALIYQYKPVAFGGSLSNNAGADTVKTVTGAQLLTYLGTADSLVFRWTVLAKDPPNPPVSTTDTFAVTIRRAPVAFSFFDDFEAYTVGQQLACQNPTGWTTWSLAPCNATEDALISSAQAFSGTKSVVIVQNNDQVKRFGTLTTGLWKITFKAYIPTGKAGYFNTLAIFNGNNSNWGMEAYFDASGAGRLFAGAAAAFPFTYTHDAWQSVEVVVNLDSNQAYFRLNGTQIRTWQWTLGGQGGGSPLQMEANDFFGATLNDQMFVDDYRVVGDTTVVGVDEKNPLIPDVFALEQNYPNPFNPSTTIRYALPKDAFVTLKIYNILGQEIISLREEMQNVGFHNVIWNGRNNAGQTIASGVYFYRLEARPADGAEPFVSFKKMLMLK